MTRPPIYLDHHATTPLDERVLEAMLPHLRGVGNADSRSHRYGRAAREAIENARAEVASLLGARPDEIVFTSGTTESNALAILGTHVDASTGAVVTHATEHRAVLEPVASLGDRGIGARILGVDSLGRVDLDAIRDSLGGASLVSLMLANNEIGTAHPVDEVAAMTSAAGVPLHVDAAQGLGYLPLDVRRIPVDLVSLSGHKIYGPQGVGALFVRRFGRARPKPLLLGGGQERGLRSGTSNVAGIVGLGAAAAILRDEGADEAARLRRERDRLAHALAGLGGIRHGDPERNHPGNLNLRFDGISADRLIVELEDTLALSTGSACSSGGRPSHVLVALGLDESARRSALRIGLGRNTTTSDVDRTIAAFTEAVLRLRGALDAPGGRP